MHQNSTYTARLNLRNLQGNLEHVGSLLSVPFIAGELKEFMVFFFDLLRTRKHRR